MDYIVDTWVSNDKFGRANQ